ncbi:hypothetical protein EDC01DRAFT_778309 [Geopyxis carbonaria]|nr:hypothetical protein EDC01DRAFT_778309 [Geopyxis carbonaria]
MSRKRSFTTTSTPPDTPKRARHPSHAPLPRPSFVTPRETSVNLASRISTLTVDILRPTGHRAVDAGVADLMSAGNGGFTVLCFLGSTVDVLTALEGVKGLLAGKGAAVYGVVVGNEAPAGRQVSILMDKRRTLTTGLGLLHPLGGGRMALDAVVVLDRESAVRMVLPVGWGCRGDEAGGNRVENVVSRVVSGVEWLGQEKPVMQLRGGEVEEAICVEVEMDG